MAVPDLSTLTTHYRTAESLDWEGPQKASNLTHIGVNVSSPVALTKQASSKHLWKASNDGDGGAVGRIGGPGLEFGLSLIFLLGCGAGPLTSVK